MICHQLVQWNIPDSDWKPCHWSLDPNWSRKNVVNGTRPHKDLIHFYSGAYAHVIYMYIYTHTLFFIVTHAIIIQVGWLVGRSVGWTTHSSSRGPQAQPPPADLRVSSGNVIAALPASFWWPSRTETGTIREERRKTKEDPAQSQEKATNELKSPTVTGHQPLAKHKSARPHPKHQPSATRSVEESTPPARKHHWDYAPQSLATPCH